MRRVFASSGIPLFQDIELLLALPEHRVPLPPYNARASQNDLFALATGNGQLIAITVEGKVSEPFGETIIEWMENASPGKRKRLEFLSSTLQLDYSKIHNIRYQLLHRTASAVLEAKRFKAGNALVLIHSFSPSDEWFSDYTSFAGLFGLQGEVNRIIGPYLVGDTDLYLGWVKGNAKYLTC